jgi:tetratricopeptide (TPR) repeat protein
MANQIQCGLTGPLSGCRLPPGLRNGFNARSAYLGKGKNGPMGIFSLSLDFENKSLKGFGFDVCGIGATFSSDLKKLCELPIPFQTPVPNCGETGLLAWNSAFSEFCGRDSEMHELNEWAADDERRVSVKFVTADGGLGKTRMAAEFAKSLRLQRWSAGFLNLNDPQTFPLGKLGTLLIVDYPEEYRDKVKELFADLVRVNWPAKVRALFLTRGKVEEWDEAISLGNAHTIVDRRPLLLKNITDDDLFRQFESAQQKAAKHLKSSPIHLPSEAFQEWLRQDPAIHRRPLFVLALALYSALRPEDEVVKYTGREVVLGLAERELSRLMRIAEKRGIKNKYAFAQLLSTANIAGSLTFAQIEEFANNQKLDLTLPKGRELREILANSTIVEDSTVQAMKPDIVASAFTIEALSKSPTVAPELVWCAVENDIAPNLTRLGRLAYDAEMTLGILKPRLERWLCSAIATNPARCRSVYGPLMKSNIAVSLREVALTASLSIIDSASSDEERASLLNNASVDLVNLGEHEKALTAIQEAVVIRRRLAAANPQAFDPHLAGSLNNLSTCWSGVGDRKQALAAIQEAVKIRRRLAAANPQAFEPGLASSLNNLSGHWRNIGDRVQALAGIQGAENIYRRLAAANPQAFEPDLAKSFNNLSICWSDVGDRMQALEASQDAVEIYRRLAEANPQVFEPDLAMSLNNLSNRWSLVGDREQALEAIQEAVEIRRRLAEANPQAFATNLARCLWVMGDLLAEDGPKDEARKCLSEGAELVQPIAAQYPNSNSASILSGLTNSLNKLTSS